MTDVLATPILAADELFRCEQYACTLTKRACVERQGKRWQRAYRIRVDAEKNAGQRLVKAGAVHPYCATDCEVGKAVAAEVGPLEALPTQRRNFGTLALARTPLNPQPTPPATPAQEEAVPKGVRSEPMPCCGSKGSRHLSTCKERGEPAKPAKKAVLPVAEVHARRAAEIAKRKRKAPPAANGPAYVTPVADLSDEDLARSIAECRAELERRQAEHEARAKKLAEVIASIGEAA